MLSVRPVEQKCQDAVLLSPSSPRSSTILTTESSPFYSPLFAASKPSLSEAPLCVTSAARLPSLGGPSPGHLVVGDEVFLASQSRLGAGVSPTPPTIGLQLSKSKDPASTLTGRHPPPPPSGLLAQVTPSRVHVLSEQPTETPVRRDPGHSRQNPKLKNTCGSHVT